MYIYIICIINMYIYICRECVLFFVLWLLLGVLWLVSTSPRPKEAPKSDPLVAVAGRSGVPVVPNLKR
jgi:hypothetical protein